MKSVTVFAPATVANVAVGFDILGHAIEGVGDEITLERAAAREVVIESIEPGNSGPSAEELAQLPRDPARNTATVGILRLIEEQALGHGFRVRLKKGIPLGSGMGGSAASAVGGVVAANRFLERPLGSEELLRYALMGEAVASGAAHPDNAAPCLYGGLVLAHSDLGVVSLPTPPGLLCVLLHPHARLDTRTARGVLGRDVSLQGHVNQSAKLAGFLAAIFKGDLSLLKRSFHDELIEPQRAHLIPGFEEVKQAALHAGALGCSISGSGPSIFAWVAGDAVAARVRDEWMALLAGRGMHADAWTSPIGSRGAAVIEER